MPSPPPLHAYRPPHGRAKEREGTSHCGPAGQLLRVVSATINWEGNNGASRRATGVRQGNVFSVAIAPVPQATQ